MTTIETLFLGVLMVTSYQAKPEQTRPECIDRHHCETATGDGITRSGVAVSQDMLRDGRVKYGDILYVQGFGYRVVNDCMGLYKHENGVMVPITNSIDLLVFTDAAERHVGTRFLKVYKLEVPSDVRQTASRS